MNQKSNNTLWYVLGAIAALLICICLFAIAAGGLWVGLTAPVARDAGPNPGVAAVEGSAPGSAPESSDQQAASPNQDTVEGDASSAEEGGTGMELQAVEAVDPTATELALSEAIVPPRDLRTLAQGLRGTGPIPEVVHESAPTYEVGDTEAFWINDSDADEYLQIDAELVYVNDVLYIWQEEGLNYRLDEFQQAADRFAEEIYPTNRNFFGSEWSPGIDNDPRLHILYSDQLGSTIAGYFSGADAVSSKAQPYSNEREMFYIRLDGDSPDSLFYMGTLAHEFQHMIHWYQDKNETTWVNEGMSELATELNGFGRGGHDISFSALPDTQLNAWSDDPNGRSEHYGNAYLFMSYFLQRFGNELTQAVVASDADGIDGFNAALEAAGRPERFDDIFADWVIANLLENPELGDGRFGYERDDLEPMAIEALHRRFPIQREGTVHQYATDYVELRGNGDLEINFRGATTSRLALNDAYSGDLAWWANRVDDSDARLTRAFDLSGVDTATLEFMTWYDIEDDYDYGYVMASTDGGQTWNILQTEDATDANPNGNNFGWALTGCSGDADSQEAGDDCDAAWIKQTADLSPFAGQEVLVRFQYITDDAVNYPGFFVDDIGIPEIDYFYDGETDDDGWISEGWIRTDNRLRQRWLVQLVELENGKEPVVTRLRVGEDGTGRWTVKDLNRRKDAILVISAMAPVTTEVAPYEYTITQN